MSNLGVRAFDDDTGELYVTPLPLADPSTARLLFRSLPGASAVHVEILDGAEIHRRFEIQADGEEDFVVHLERTEDGRLDAWSQGREVLSLPPDERYAPAPPMGSHGAALLDVAVLVDGTARWWGDRDGGSGDRPGPTEPARLLGDGEAWSAHVERLVEIVAGLAGESDLRAGAFAFGDDEPAGLRGPGLHPAYRLYPGEGAGWRLEALAPDDLRARLLAVPATSGGDFVDALADALEACVELPWREGSRRLVLLTGDSPGYSILHPAPAGASLLPRRLDVDTQSLALHRLGVEIATLFHRPPPEIDPGFLDFERALLDHAACQYRRLASRPELAFEATALEASDVVRSLQGAPRWIARGAAYGILLEAQGDGR